MPNEVVSKDENRIVHERGLYQGIEKAESDAAGDHVDTRPTHIKANTQVKQEQNADEDVNAAQADGNLSAEEQSWAKRYGDLRRHEAAALAESEEQHARELEALKSQYQTAVADGTEITDEEYDAFQSSNPEAVRIMRKVNARANAERDAKMNEVLDKLDKANRKAARDSVEKNLYKDHPDWVEVTKSDAFHVWADNQSEEVQSWVFGPPNALLSDAITYYKEATGVKGRKKKTTKNDAAQLVDTRSDTRIEDSGKPVYAASYIDTLDGENYTDELQADIRLAISEGRIDYDR